MRLFLILSRKYPRETAAMMIAILLAGISEGLGISALLPMLNLAISGEDKLVNVDASSFETKVANGLHYFGLSPTIGVLLSIIFVAVTMKALLILFANKRIGYTVAHVVTELRLALLNAILAARWDYFLSQKVGQLVNSMAVEPMRASEAYVNSTTVIISVVQAIVYLTIAFLISWKPTLICLLVSIVVLFGSHFLIDKSRRAGKRQTILFRSLFSRLTDTLQSVKPLKAMARQSTTTAILAAETNQLNKALRKEAFSSAAMSSIQEYLFSILVVAGLYLALARWHMPLATAMVLVILAVRMLKQLSVAQKQYQKMAVGESAFWALHETINDAEHAEETFPGKTQPKLEKAIRFEQVEFSYGKNEPVLKDLSLNIPAGSLTTIIGASGGGKTTILDLILGLHLPTKGQILLDDTPLDTIDLKNWRKLIGYVPQEQLLLHDSIFINVTLGDPEMVDADVEYALRAAGAWEFVEQLPDGIQSNVGERGTKLSGGQRQRIIIARALVHRPKLLILDEATSALDPDSQLKLSKTIKNLRGEYTMIAVSHQAALVDIADHVYKLEGMRATPMQELGSLGTQEAVST
jgi:ATP-binding cassette subfamily C protein